jgi:hypothetical protein
MAACVAASLLLAVQLMGIVPFEVAWSVRSMLAQASTPPVSLPQLSARIGIDSRPVNQNFRYGDPTNTTKSNRSGSGGSAAVLVPAVQPPGVFPSLPGAPTESTDFWPYWYIIRAIHVHMIQRGYAAAAVAGAWLVLALAGWWRPEPGWIDRLGRVLGFLWIVPYLVYHADLSRLW